MSSSLTATLRETAAAIEDYPSTTDELRLLQVAANAIVARQAEVVGLMAERGDHEHEGASSVKNWLRQHLHLDSLDAHSLVTTSRTLTEMPLLADVADAGEVSLDHVRVFTHARRHLQPEDFAAVEHDLLGVAVHAEPEKLRGTVREIRDILYPDSLEEAWIRGMDKQDIKLAAVGEGCSIAATPLMRWLHSSPGSCRSTPEPSSRPSCSLSQHPPARRTTGPSRSVASRHSTSC